MPGYLFKSIIPVNSIPSITQVTYIQQLADTLWDIFMAYDDCDHYCLTRYLMGYFMGHIFKIRNLSEHGVWSPNDGCVSKWGILPKCPCCWGMWWPWDTMRSWDTLCSDTPIRLFIMLIGWFSTFNFGNLMHHIYPQLNLWTWLKLSLETRLAQAQRDLLGMETQLQQLKLEAMLMCAD